MNWTCDKASGCPPATDPNFYPVQVSTKAAGAVIEPRRADIDPALRAI